MNVIEMTTPLNKRILVNKCGKNEGNKKSTIGKPK